MKWVGAWDTLSHTKAQRDTVWSWGRRFLRCWIGAAIKNWASQRAATNEIWTNKTKRNDWVVSIELKQCDTSVHYTKCKLQQQHTMSRSLSVCLSVWLFISKWGKTTTATDGILSRHHITRLKELFYFLCFVLFGFIIVCSLKPTLLLDSAITLYYLWYTKKKYKILFTCRAYRSTMSTGNCYCTPSVALCFQLLVLNLLRNENISNNKKNNVGVGNSY